MKRILYILTSLLLAFPLYSQDGNPSQRTYRDGPKPVQTIFGPNVGNGGYGALSLGYTQIEKRDAIIIGGRGEWVIGHGFGIGVGGYGFINDPEYYGAENQYYNLSGGYGGLVMEPIIMGRWPVHISLPVLLGAGGIARTSFDEISFLQDNAYNAYLEEASVFLIAEPGVELEFNLLKWMRLAFYGTYRFTTNINMLDVDKTALIGWNAGVTMKIGIF